MIGAFFPNSVLQAVAILDACDDNLEAACEMARMNAIYADESENDKDFWKWIAVRNALVPERSAQA